VIPACRPNFTSCAWVRKPEFSDAWNDLGTTLIELRQRFQRVVQRHEILARIVGHDQHVIQRDLLRPAAPFLRQMCARVVDAMATIEGLIGRKENEARSYLLRPHRAGDMGWVVERHGVLYGAEYGWDSRIEGLTAEIVAAFLKNLDPARERCWIAEIGGEPVGSVFLVKESDEVARLRLLIVDPKARGLGIGRRLVDECIAFARQAGYSKITLWTHGVLKAARGMLEYLIDTALDRDYNDVTSAVATYPGCLTTPGRPARVYRMAQRTRSRFSG